MNSIGMPGAAKPQRGGRAAAAPRVPGVPGPIHRPAQGRGPRRGGRRGVRSRFSRHWTSRQAPGTPCRFCSSAATALRLERRRPPPADACRSTPRKASRRPSPSSASKPSPPGGLGNCGRTVGVTVFGYMDWIAAGFVDRTVFRQLLAQPAAAPVLNRIHPTVADTVDAVLAQEKDRIVDQELAYPCITVGESLATGLSTAGEIQALVPGRCSAGGQRTRCWRRRISRPRGCKRGPGSPRCRACGTGQPGT